MRKTILLLLVTINCMFGSILIAGENNNIISSQYDYNSPYIDSLQKAGRQIYHPGMIYLKLKETAFNSIKKGDIVFGSNIGRFGIKSIDNILSRSSCDIRKAFVRPAAYPKKVNDRMLSNSNLHLNNLDRVFTVSFDGPVKLKDIIKSLSLDNNVEYAEPVPVSTIMTLPDDDYYSAQAAWFEQINAEAAWDLHKCENGPDSIVVGICDTGVEWFHPDLIDNLYRNLGEDADGDGHVIEKAGSIYVFDPDDINGIDDDGNGYADDFIGWDFMYKYADQSENNNPLDLVGHGTYVAGLLSAVTNNGLGVAALPWNVKFLPTSHTTSIYPGKIFRGYDGIKYLAENGADVINCSWGNQLYSKTNDEVIEYVHSLGAVVFASAGNDNLNLKHYPASYPHVVSVAALDDADRKASYSTYNSAVDISAPGGTNAKPILSTIPDDSYSSDQGTSVSCPIAAGLYVLLKSYYPEWTTGQLLTKFFTSADSIYLKNTAYTNELGYGRINAGRALSEEIRDLPRNLNVGLAGLIIDDENDNMACEPGEIINLGFKIMNYNHLLGAEEASFRVVSYNQNIEILTPEFQGVIGADGYTLTETGAQIRIKESAPSSIAKLSLSIDANDIDISDGVLNDFEIAINAGDVYVWQAGIQENLLSTGFIADFLEGQGYDILTSNYFPSSFTGFDAVILSFGGAATIGEDVIEPYFLDVEKAEIIKNYLKTGGKLFIEGTDFLGKNQADDEELFELLGIKSVNDGIDDIAFTSLNGLEGSACESINFEKSRIEAYTSLDTYETESGTNVFELENAGIVAVQNEGQYGQKTFVMSLPLVDLVDAGQPSSRYELVRRILMFLDYPIDYTIPQIIAEPYYGHMPLTVQFYENSYTSIPITEWKWEFNNDYIVDSYDKSDEWTYTKPGYYTATLWATNSEKTHEIEQDIFVFDGESSIKTCGDDELALIGPAESLDISGAFTIEAWIYPEGLGENSEYNTLIDKETFSINYTNAGSLRFFSYHADDGYTEFTTPFYTLVTDKWQHIAITFDGDTTYQFFLNGSELTNFINRTISPNGELLSNRYYPFSLGNLPTGGRCFNGRIDELRVWDRARSELDINSTLLTRLSGQEDGLIGYWSFQEGAGAVAADLSKNENDCALTGSWRQGWREGIIQEHPYDYTDCLQGFGGFYITVLELDRELTFKWKKDGEPIYDNGTYVNTDSIQMMVMGITEDDLAEYSCEVTIKEDQKRYNSKYCQAYCP